MNRPRTIEELKQWGTGRLPGLIGFELLDAGKGLVRASIVVRPELLAPNGYLHAASVIALADTACGYGTIFDLPEEARGFTTIELKTNFLGTCLEGKVICEASRVHTGRSTQVWDAIVTDESAGRNLALFRCTQMILLAADKRR